jgi:hypothetical protein
MCCSRIKQHNCRSVIDEKHTNDHVRSFLHSNMVDPPTSIVGNGVGSTGRGRCSCSSLIGTVAQIGASVSEMTLFSTSKTPSFSVERIRSSLGPLNTLIPNSRILEIVGTPNHFTLQVRKSLSSCLRPWLELHLSRTEHGSS